MLNWKIVSISLGLWSTVSFIICVIWDLVMPSSLSMQTMWEMLLPGFVWLSTGSFILGIVETFLFGLYSGILFVVIYNPINNWIKPDLK